MDRQGQRSVAALFACLVGIAIAKAQAPAERAPLSDEVFKNIQ